MGVSKGDVLTALGNAAADDVIVTARLGVLEAGDATLQRIADMAQTSGRLSRDDRALAVALLCRLASELSAGIAVLCRGSHVYAAGALLRQLVEIEYLMFLGYMDPAKLSSWYTADGKQLRTTFSPQRMRDASDGLFRDQEYWHHCEVGGHPHPRARMLLDSYRAPLAPIASLLPDAVHHLRRLWRTLGLLYPKLDVGDLVFEEPADPLVQAIERWIGVEDPLILSFDGIGTRTGED